MSDSKATKQKTYNVSVNLTGSFIFEVYANSLEEALTLARKTTGSEMLGNISDWSDYETEITGIF